ncbi:MAG: peptidylprolyl isomerase [Burkholderiaceae bacterium]
MRPNEIVTEDEAMRRLRDIKRRVRDGYRRLRRAGTAILGRRQRGPRRRPRLDLSGDTVPEFERAMNALAPGQVSEQVRTPFGIHLIQVLERRTDAASPDRVRQVARQALRGRRIEELPGLAAPTSRPPTSSTSSS